jgi:uncharacterized membrane protein YsdA (DUF1294 family)
VGAAFIAVTCVWLALDHAVQDGDAAQHVYVAVRFEELLERGGFGTIASFPNYYPPTTFLVGAFAMLIGGVNVGTAVIAQNLVYVPLLAASCFYVGRMASMPPDATAGLLAVVFAFGTPLVIEQFHVFMLDAPQAALVAATVWMLLASDRFERLGPSALAGLALGVGFASKSLAPSYLVGLVPALLLRGGGWRNWRGMLLFAGVALAVGSPWYLYNTERIVELITAAGPAGEMIPEAARPSLASLDNVLWYGWATLNGLLFAPLFAFAAVGVVAAVRRVVRARPPEDLTLELLCGFAGAWLALTLMPHKDMRYTISLIVFIAVLGTAWVVRLGRVKRALAIAYLIAAVGLAHVGATIGVGGTTERVLPGSRFATLGEGVMPRDRVIVYTNHNFLVSKPHGGGHLLDLFRTMRASGVTGVYWLSTLGDGNSEFSGIGLLAFAEMTGLESDPERRNFEGFGPNAAVLIRAYRFDEAGPCLWLDDGSGVWIRRGDPLARNARNWCPLRRPAFYAR